MEKYIKGEFMPGTLRLPVCRRRLSGELGEELSLPDYQPAVGRLLRVTPTLTPPARYLGGGRLELSGSVSYAILYAGEDDQLYSVTLPGSYSLETEPDDIPGAALTEDACVLAAVRPDSVTGRMTAPRRISLRLRISADVTCLCDCRIDEQLEGTVSEPELRRLLGEAEYGDAVHAEEESVPLEDEIIPEPGEGELRVIAADGAVLMGEVSAGRDCMVCRGELLLRLLCCREEGECSAVWRRLPFVRELSAPRVCPGWDCRGAGKCQSVNVSVEDGRLLCEAAISLEAEAYHRESVAFTRDIYSTGGAAEVTCCERRVWLPVRVTNGNFSQSGVFDAAEVGLPPSARIVDVTGTAAADSISAERGRCVVTGEVCYSVVYRDGEQYGSVELCQPLRYETDLPGTAADAVLDGSATLTVMSCRARMDGERVAVDCEIGVALAAGQQDRIKMLEHARFGAPGAPRGDCIVCYPDSSDTLWSVARRYLADADDIAAANSLEVRSPDASDSLRGVSFIII